MMVCHLKKIILLLTVLLMMELRNALARPGHTEEFRNKCKFNDQRVIEVCQRCAKQTKSPIVYPMCCEDEEDVFNWCDRYINYGKSS